MKVAILTGIFGGYDVLRPLPEEVRGTCFTDNVAPARGWKLKPYSADLSPRLLNRRVKVLAHHFVKADIVLYVDGQFAIHSDPRPWALEALGDSDFAAFRNPFRSCVYEEGWTCIKQRRGDPEAIRAQLDRYRSEGLPKSSGLFAGGVLVRRMTAATREFCEAWWNEIQNGSERDQISLAYLAWKHGFPIRAIPGSYREPPFELRGHRKKSS